MTLLIRLADKPRPLRESAEDDMLEPRRETSRTQLLCPPVPLDVPALTGPAAERWREPGPTPDGPVTTGLSSCPPQSGSPQANLEHLELAFNHEIARF